MLRSFTAIANNGIMLEPKFISALYNPNTDTARVSSKEEVGNPVSEQAADDTLRYMINVGTDPVYGTLYSHDLQGQQFKLMAMILQLNQVRRKSQRRWSRVH